MQGESGLLHASILKQSKTLIVYAGNHFHLHPGTFLYPDSHRMIERKNVKG